MDIEKYNELLARAKLKQASRNIRYLLKNCSGEYWASHPDLLDELREVRNEIDMICHVAGNNRR